MTKIAIILVGLVALASAEPHGPSLGEVKDYLEELEASKNELFQTLSNIATVCAVADDRFAILQDQYVDFLEFGDITINKFIETFKGQAKEILHRVDAAQADCEAVEATAEYTQSRVTDQISYLGGLVDLDDEQDEQIESFDLTDWNVFVEDVIEDVIEDLGDDIGDVSFYLSELEGFLSARKCEYGFINLSPGLVNVDFKTEFDITPQIAMQIVGFNAHLDVSHYHDDSYNSGTNVLGLDKYIESSNSTGFSIALQDNSQGEIELKGVYASWSACQYVDESFDFLP